MVELDFWPVLLRRLQRNYYGEQGMAFFFKFKKNANYIFRPAINQKFWLVADFFYFD
jgi:hypothetical protein